MGQTHPFPDRILSISSWTLRAGRPGKGFGWVFGVLHGTCASLLGQGLHMGSPMEQGPYRTRLPYSVLCGPGSAYRPGHFCGVPQDPIWTRGSPLEPGSYMAMGLPYTAGLPHVVPYGAGLPYGVLYGTGAAL